MLHTERKRSSNPSLEGRSRSTPELRAYHRTQVALYPSRFRLMALVGVVAISLFFLIDISYNWPDYVKLTPRQFFGIRALWVACYLLMLATSFYREIDERWQAVRDFILITVTSSFLGVVTAHTGRLASPYYGGLVLMLLSRCVLLPGALVRTTVVCLFMVVLWAFVAALYPAPLPMGWPDGQFGKVLSNMTFIVTSLIMSLFGAYLADRLVLGLETAKLMGRYRLGKRIGVGGMGEVYLAYHASLRRPCAVKILKEELCDDHATKRFEREAEAASRLRHPNTIAVFDFGRTETGQPYYVMEYLEGCDLRQLVASEGPLPPGRVQHLLLQAARSLAEAHSLSFVHRDIKPGNLFVTKVGGQADFIKVLDFGLVKGADLGPDLTKVSAFMGTPRYMAPEALNGQDVDSHADVYALGAVAYFMLCGQPPFSSNDPYADIHRQLTEPPPPIATRRDPRLELPSPELEAVILRCLAREIDKRYRDAGELVAALEQVPEHRCWQPHSGATPGPMPSEHETEDERAPTLPADGPRPAKLKN